MKNLWFIGLFVISIALIGCSGKGKEDTKLNQTKEGVVNEPGATANTQGNMVNGENNPQQKGTTVGSLITKADAAFAQKVQNGEIIMITDEGKQEPFKFNGSSKIKAMKLPDGNLHQVVEKGDRTFINVPGKGEMGIIMLNHKFYLFDDKNQAYEMKFINQQLFAEKTDLTNVVLSRK